MHPFGEAQESGLPGPELMTVVSRPVSSGNQTHVLCMSSKQALLTVEPLVQPPGTGQISIGYVFISHWHTHISE